MEPIPRQEVLLTNASVAMLATLDRLTPHK